MIRLIRDRSAEVRRAREISFAFDGMPVRAYAGETVATALLRAGHLSLRDAPSGGPRGMFCCMGLCQECAVRVDGTVVEACRLTVFDGLAVRSGRAPG